MRFLPPTSTLEPLRPATHAQWMAEVEASPPFELDAPQRRALAGLLASYLGPPVPLIDDPEPAQREGVAEPLPPFHHRGCRRAL